MTPLSAAADIGVLDLGGSQREELLLQSAFDESNGELSPDGHWLAYQSNESGTSEVYVRPFPNVATSKWLVSTGGGTRPLWSRNGRELFYYVDPGTIMAVSVTLGSSFSFDKPTVAVKVSFSRPLIFSRHYDVSSDGKRFLLLKDVETTSTGKPMQPELRIVLHFSDELERLVPKRN